MKVSTITCSNADNYGARLQTFALATWLKREGHDAQVLDYRPWYMRAQPRIWPRVSRPADLRSTLSVLLNYRYCRDAHRRHAAFERFSQRRIPLSERTYNSAAELRTHTPEAGAFIAGSDQIWNCARDTGLDPAFYLYFAPESSRRIAYAASFGNSRMNDRQKTRLRERLAGFDSISVREQAGAALIAELGLPEPFVAVDPAFLLPAGFWESLCRDDLTPQEPYVLVYDFMRSRTLRDAALQVARATGSRVISVGAYRLPYAHRNITTASPEEFLSLIRGARCVVSNSYHGTVFAMIFGRDFITTDREDGLNERMHYLLARYGLDSRRDPTTDPVDYDTVRPLLQADISASENFLRNALKER